MTKEELLKKIAELESAAQRLDEPDKTFALSDVDQLKIQIEGLALSDLAAKMQAIQLPDLAEIDTQIAAAKKATAAQAAMVEAVSKGCQGIKFAMKLAL